MMSFITDHVSLNKLKNILQFGEYNFVRYKLSAYVVNLFMTTQFFKVILIKENNIMLAYKALSMVSASKP